MKCHHFLAVAVSLSVTLEEIKNKAVIQYPYFNVASFTKVSNKIQVIVLNLLSPFPGRSNSKPYRLPADRSTEGCSYEEYWEDAGRSIGRSAPGKSALHHVLVVPFYRHAICSPLKALCEPCMVTLLTTGGFFLCTLCTLCTFAHQVIWTEMLKWSMKVKQDVYV